MMSVVKPTIIATHRPNIHQPLNGVAVFEDEFRFFPNQLLFILSGHENSSHKTDTD